MRAAAEEQAAAAQRSVDLLVLQLEDQLKLGRGIVQSAVQSSLSAIAYWKELWVLLMASASLQLFDHLIVGPASYRIVQPGIPIRFRSYEPLAAVASRTLFLRTLCSTSTPFKPTKTVTLSSPSWDAAVMHASVVSVINAKQRHLELKVPNKLKTAKRIFLIGDQDSAGHVQ